MVIHQTVKQSELEKRLKLLKTQIYGKGVAGNPKLKISGKTSNSISDITYLRSDLLKISLLSALAIGAQFIIFFILKEV